MELNVQKVEYCFYYKVNDSKNICSKIIITAYGEFANISIYIEDILIAQKSSINYNDDEMLTDFARFAVNSINDYCFEKEYPTCKRVYDEQFDKLCSQLLEECRITDNAAYEAITKNCYFKK